MAKHDTPTETREQLLLRRVFKQIAPNYFNDNKLLPWYAGHIKFEKKLGDDIAAYLRKVNPEYVKKLDQEDRRKYDTD